MPQQPSDGKGQLSTRDLPLLLHRRPVEVDLSGWSPRDEVVVGSMGQGVVAVPVLSR